MAAEPSCAWVSICIDRKEASQIRYSTYLKLVLHGHCGECRGSNCSFSWCQTLHLETCGGHRPGKDGAGWAGEGFCCDLLLLVKKNGAGTISMWRWPQKHKLQGMKLLYRQSMWHIFSGGGHCFCQILWAKEDWRKMMEEARLHVCYVRCTLSLHLFATTSCFQAVSLCFTDCNAIVSIQGRPEQVGP